MKSRVTIMVIWGDSQQKTLAGKYIIPATPISSLGISLAAAAPVSTAAAVTGGYLGDKAVDAGMKFATGQTWAEYVNENGVPYAPWWLKSMTQGLDKEPATMTNPGTHYGGWVGNNFSHLGRYTLNYLNPRGYGDYVTRLKDVYTKPFYTSPPTFFNGRKPKWYTGSIGDEVRFQNGAIWAGIPEEEVPRTLIQRNADGTYRLTRQAIEIFGKNNSDLVGDYGLGDQRTINEALKKGSIDYADVFSTVGGEHSDYMVLKDFPKGVLGELRDKQQLNPQWQLSDWIKKRYSLRKNTTPYNIIDWLGGINLSRSLGYKPFTYRQGIGILKDGSSRTFYFDPSHWERTGIINPE